MLGAAGVFLLVRRARSADQPIRIPLPSWLTPPSAATGPHPHKPRRRAPTRRGAAGRRDPRPAFLAATADAARWLYRPPIRPHPGDDHGRHARTLLHLGVHRQVRQVVQGPSLRRHVAGIPVLVDAGVAHLHHRHRRAALRARHRRPADEEQRADRHAGVRHQPVSHGAADGRVLARGRRGDGRHPGKRAGHRQPARRPAQSPHSDRIAADLWLAQSQVDRRPWRRDLSLPVPRPAPAGAEPPDGVRVRSGGPHAQDAAVRAEGHLHGGRASRRGTAMGDEPGLGPRIRTRQPGPFHAVHRSSGALSSRPSTSSPKRASPT